VRKGEHAIILCQPKPWSHTEVDEATGEEKTRSGVRFTYRPAWFVLSQTDGDDVEVPSLPDWDADRAMQALGVTKVPFTMPDGNVQGYSQGRDVALNPVATDPLGTLVHELAHSILHQKDGDLFLSVSALPRNLKEVEAEATALIVLEALGLTDRTANARGYIQHWLHGETIPEANAARIFSAADKILRAGQPARTTEAEAE
jgi:antirestriction protein ArdC